MNGAMGVLDRTRNAPKANRTRISGSIHHFLVVLSRYRYSLTNEDRFFDTTEPFLLRRGDDLPVAHQSGSAVVEECRDA